MKIRDINEQFERLSSQGFKIVPTIVNSSGISSRTPILTSLRSFNNIISPSFVVSSQDQAVLLVQHISSYVQEIFVDAEKKIPFQVHNDEFLLGNIYSAIIQNTFPNKIFPFKANDLTVDSLLDTLFTHYTDLAGMQIGVVGLGNIGSKISIALVECGVSVILYSRDFNRANNIASFINSIKPSPTMSMASPAATLDQIFFSSQAILLCGNSTINLSKFSLECLVSPRENPDLIIQVGHDLIGSHHLKRILEISPFLVHRLDISDSIEKLINSQLILKNSPPVALSDYYSKRSFVSHGLVPTFPCYVVNDARSPLALVKDNYQDLEELSIAFTSGSVEFE